VNNHVSAVKTNRKCPISLDELMSVCTFDEAGLPRQRCKSKNEELILLCERDSTKGVFFHHGLNMLYLCNTSSRRTPYGAPVFRNPDATIPSRLYESLSSERIIPIYLDGFSDPQVPPDTLQRQPSFIGPNGATWPASARERFRLLEGLKAFYDDCRTPEDFAITSVRLSERFPSNQISFTYSAWSEKVKDSDLGLLSLNDFSLFNTAFTAVCRISNDQFVRADLRYIARLGARLTYLNYDRVLDRALTSTRDVLDNSEIISVANQFMARSTEHSDWMWAHATSPAIYGRIIGDFVSRVAFEAHASTFTDDYRVREHCFYVCPDAFSSKQIYRNGLTIILRLSGIENVMFGRQVFELDGYNVQQFERNFLNVIKLK
jgi:hypothetical protein